MPKQKKISIQLYLNKNLKSRISYPFPINVSDADKEKLAFYPLYVRVRYNRKNTNFRFHSHRDDTVRLCNSYEDLETEEFKEYEKVLKNIIRLEVNRLGDKFKLKGIGNKVYNYHVLSLKEILAKLADININIVIGQHLVHKDYERISKIKDAWTRLGEAYKIVKFNLDSAVELIWIDYLKESLAEDVSPYSWFINGEREAIKEGLLETIKSWKKEFPSGQFTYHFIVVHVETMEKYFDLFMKLLDAIILKAIEGEYSKKRPKIENIRSIDGKVIATITK